VIVCLSVRIIVLEPTYEDFQEQVYEDFKMKYMSTLIFSFQSNEASVLDHILSTTFSINSVELELVIPRSEKEGTKPPYVCPGCSNHTYSNNMITRFHVQ
jgi:hypothetical protein